MSKHSHNIERKPLGGKAYGSIAHMPSSRLGPGDWKCTAGEQEIATSSARPGDTVFVMTKVDGANCAVANIEGEIVPLIRAGYRARDARYDHLLRFETWALAHADRWRAILAPGERLCGEWLIQAHATRYDLTGREPFVPFDIIVQGKPGERRVGRRLFDDVIERCTRIGLAHVPVLSRGPAISIEEAYRRACLPEFRFGAIDPPEGCVWRVERNGVVHFVIKWVHPDKRDGIFLPGISGLPPIWNVDITHEHFALPSAAPAQIERDEALGQSGAIEPAKAVKPGGSGSRAGHRKA